MDKVLIVGHQSSNYKILEKILHICGMAKPINSYTHNMTPQEISIKLNNSLKNTNINIKNPSVKKINYQANQNEMFIVDNTHHYHQKKPKKIWDNLSFDLLLANIEQDFWGWSDSEALSLLEYWANFDENMAFILTYDWPYQLLRQLCQTTNISEINEETIISLLQDWVSYNQELLEFYKKYSNRCLLVNGEQVMKSAERYVDSVIQKVTWHISEPFAELSNALIENPDYNEAPIEINIFIDLLLQQHKDSLNAYNTIQKYADIPLVSENKNVYFSNILDGLKSSLQREKSLQNTKNILSNTQAEMKEKEQQISLIQQQLTTTENIYQQTKKQLEEYTKESTLLISQIHKVQEELENYYLKEKQDNEQLKNIQEQLHKKQEQLSTNQTQISALMEKLTDSNSQINNLKKVQVDLRKENQAQQQESELLIKQLHLLQEELEAYYIEKKGFQKKITDISKQVEDSKQEYQKLKELADKRQRELIEKQNNIKVLDLEKKKIENQAKEEQQKLTKLQAEMDKVYTTNNELSTIKQENELLINQLHKVQEELEKYYLENKQGTNGTSFDTNSGSNDTKKVIYYGAADRIKNDLPYRLGSKMVKSSKKPKDIVSLPFSLVQEYRSFQQEKKDIELPPLEQYHDLDKAEKIKQHLSYRLGKTIVDSVKSPKKLVKLPVDISKEVINFYKK